MHSNINLLIFYPPPRPPPPSAGGGDNDRDIVNNYNALMGFKNLLKFL